MSQNPDRVELTYWLGFYHSLTQLTDLPPKDVMENDFLLDDWLKAKRKDKDYSKLRRMSQRKGAPHEMAEF